MKKLILFLCIVGAIGINPISAQKREAKATKKHSKPHCWDAGLLAGVAYYNGEMHCPDLGLSNLRPGGGVYTRYAFNDKLFGRLNFQFGQIQGKDNVFNEDWRKLRNFSFSSVFYDGALLLEWEPFGALRYGRSGKTFRRILSPYIHSGIAGVYSKPDVNFNEPNLVTQQSDIDIDKSNKKFFHPAIPIGGGLKYDLNKSWTIGAEAAVRIAFTDYLDGVSMAGNPNKRDWYETFNLNLGYRFPCKRDKDNDGVPDDMDTCPDEPGTSKTKGCPDRDQDGISDKNDKCPDEAGTSLTGGCPDTDGDTILDKDDECPTEKGLAAFKGCPDTDGDGIADKEDECPNEIGTLENKGCPVIDTDKDGVADKEDKCPEVAGLASNGGCPEVSTEKTTLTTEATNVLTTNNVSSASTTSTTQVNTTSNLSNLPVSDVVILEETTTIKKAPKVKKSASKSKSVTATKKSKQTTVRNPATESIIYNNTATPINDNTTSFTQKSGTLTKVDISTADQNILMEAINGIYFDNNKATLKSNSYDALNKVASVIRQYPDYVLRITGHTDDKGDDLANVKLSVARARAIYNYFLKQGLSMANLSYRGCGSGNPVDDNSTEEGRAKNRRVEFDMLTFK